MSSEIKDRFSNEIKVIKGYVEYIENNFYNILYGEGEKHPNRYELTDFNGNKISINDLNGYQKGVVLNDCWAYFTGGKYHSDTKEPCGVVGIKEEEI